MPPARGSSSSIGKTPRRVALDRAPRTLEYRDFLSKHYFNYARALRHAGRPADAAAMALERRSLWPDDGEHLFQVSLELARSLDALSSGVDDTVDAEHRREIADEALATLKQAVDAGYAIDGALEEFDELASLRGHPQFDDLQREIEFLRVDSADHEGGR